MTFCGHFFYIPQALQPKHSSIPVLHQYYPVIFNIYHYMVGFIITTQSVIKYTTRFVTSIMFGVYIHQHQSWKNIKYHGLPLWAQPNHSLQQPLSCQLEHNPIIHYNHQWIVFMNTIQTFITTTTGFAFLNTI